VVADGARADVVGQLQPPEKMISALATARGKYAPAQRADDRLSRVFTPRSSSCNCSGAMSGPAAPVSRWVELLKHGEHYTGLEDLLDHCGISADRTKRIIQAPAEEVLFRNGLQGVFFCDFAVACFQENALTSLFSPSASKN